MVLFSLCFLLISGQVEIHCLNEASWEVRECADEDTVQMMQVSLFLRPPTNSPSTLKSHHNPIESPPPAPHPGQGLSNENITTNEFSKTTSNNSVVSIVTDIVSWGTYLFDGMAMIVIAVFVVAVALGKQFSLSELFDDRSKSSSPSSPSVQTHMPYYFHSGEQPGGSWRTLTYAQLKLITAGYIFFQLGYRLYMVLANILIYITMHHVPPNSPSDPGHPGQHDPSSHNFQHAEMFDLGFQIVPDWSARPFWILMLIHLQVVVAHRLPLVLLIHQGRTYGFICYFGMTTILFILKGFVQLMTVLPPANHGEACWDRNFDPAQLAIIKERSFWDWSLEWWGTSQGCNDMLWSGHTCNSVVAYLYLNNMAKHLRMGFIIRFLLVLYALGYIWLILACRMHYTVDVFLAILVSVALCTNSSLCFTLWKWANIIVGNELFSAK